MLLAYEAAGRLSSPLVSLSRRQAVMLAAVLALSSSFYGCMTDETASASTLAGVVTDELGVPVDNAVVMATSASTPDSMVTASLASTTTNASGKYKLVVPEGATRISVVKDGYASAAGELAQRGPRGQMHFDLAGRGSPLQRIDTDGDGLVSQTEWKGPSEEFQRIDTDGDGQLSQAELETARLERRNRHPGHGPMDQDGDGLISRSEWMGPAAHFTELDTDGNGQLSQAETRLGKPRRVRPDAAGGAGSGQ
ncbi:MAG: carboxypeptidase regulatory-like domain-containing protein [Candidatus Wallbacteria bacterium]|nr:carboxypeptidase regulatory-like domain-containing protein [Candidatus Wallbacteria bacterium]